MQKRTRNSVLSSVIKWIVIPIVMVALIVFMRLSFFDSLFGLAAAKAMTLITGIIICICMRKTLDTDAGSKRWIMFVFFYVGLFTTTFFLLVYIVPGLPISYRSDVTDPLLRPWDAVAFGAVVYALCAAILAMESVWEMIEIREAQNKMQLALKNEETLRRGGLRLLELEIHKRNGESLGESLKKREELEVVMEFKKAHPIIAAYLLIKAFKEIVTSSTFEYFEDVREAVIRDIFWKRKYSNTYENCQNY